MRMKVEKIINNTDDLRSFEFINKVLPSAILNNHNLLSNGIHIKDILEEQIAMHWETYCEKNNYDKDPYPNFEFIYTVRLKRNKQRNSNSCIFFFKIPTIDIIDIDDTPIAAALLISDIGIARFFALKELTDELVPVRFIKNNENFLLYELSKDLDRTNWGKLINPRNISDFSETIFYIGEV